MAGSSARIRRQDLVAVDPGHHDVEEDHVNSRARRAPPAPGCAPPDAVRTVQPRGAQDRVEEPEVLRLVVDGEDRDVRVHPAPRPGPAGAGHLHGQGAHLQRLLEVAVEPVWRSARAWSAGIANAVDGDDRHLRGGASEARIRRSASDPSMPGSWRSMEHQVGALLDGETDPLLPGGGLDDAVAGRTGEHVAARA